MAILMKILKWKKTCNSFFFSYLSTKMYCKRFKLISVNLNLLLVHLRCHLLLKYSQFLKLHSIHSNKSLNGSKQIWRQNSNEASPNHHQEERGSRPSAALGAGSEFEVNSFLRLPVSLQVTVDLMSEVHAAVKLQHIFIWDKVERLQGWDLAPLHFSQAPVPNVKPVEAASVSDGNL